MDDSGVLAESPAKRRAKAKRVRRERDARRGLPRHVLTMRDSAGGVTGAALEGDEDSKATSGRAAAARARAAKAKRRNGTDRLAKLGHQPSARDVDESQDSSHAADMSSDSHSSGAVSDLSTSSSFYWETPGGEGGAAKRTRAQVRILPQSAELVLRSAQRAVARDERGRKAGSGTPGVITPHTIPGAEGQAPAGITPSKRRGSNASRGSKSSRRGTARSSARRSVVELEVEDMDADEETWHSPIAAPVTPIAVPGSASPLDMSLSRLALANASAGEDEGAAAATRRRRAAGSPDEEGDSPRVAGRGRDASSSLLDSSVHSSSSMERARGSHVRSHAARKI